MKTIFLISFLQITWIPLYSLCNIESRIEELERHVPELRVVTPNETCGANTGLARPILDTECGSCESNFFIEASVLYWFPKVAGTEFINGVYSLKKCKFMDKPFSVGSTKHCLEFVDLSANWGFRVGFGYNLPCDGWDLFLNYTSFNSKGDKSVGKKKTMNI